jgi:O-antigen/teichoic acid export membrane protein
LVTQVFRFGTNLLLTRILAPELFGIMVLLVSLRVGIELFTDLGIGQNVIANENGYEPRFYQTAWTLGIVRGLLLALASLAIVPLLSGLYDDDQLDRLLPFLSLFFILTGFVSVGLPLSTKAMRNEQIAKYEVVASSAGAVVMIGAAVVSPNIWGLLTGNLLGTLASTAASYFIMPDVKHRLVLDQRFVREIIGFGKWIFLASIVYFLATNFDRLVLAKFVSFAMLGIYGVARSLGDVLGQFSGKIGSAIIFPGVASSELRGSALQSKLLPRRRQFLAVAALGVAAFIALGEALILVLYDSRYSLAGQVMPWVGLATWMFVLNTLNENVLMGLGKPVYMTVGNTAKLLGLAVLLPPGVIHFGILGAAAATAGAEVLRYICLTLGQSRERVRFTRQDIMATACMLAAALLLRGILFNMGLTSSPVALFSLTP